MRRETGQSSCGQFCFVVKWLGGAFFVLQVLSCPAVIHYYWSPLLLHLADSWGGTPLQSKFPIWLVSQVLGLIQMMWPNLCDPVREKHTLQHGGVSCLKPLFAPDELIDVYMYASTSAYWSTTRGFALLQKGLMWNRTGLVCVRVCQDLTNLIRVPWTI